MRTNLEWFRSFKAIYETGTLTEAAKQLSLSQPGVSLHLSSLEAYTGFPLFERRSKKMLPTEKGKMLYNQVESLLTSFDGVEELLHRKPGNYLRPTLSFGVCAEMFQFFLDDELPRLDFNLIAKFENDDCLHQLLEKNILDLIITNKKKNEKDWEYEDFFVEKIVLVAGKYADVETIQNLINQQEWDEAKSWLKEQKWYGTAADMEHIAHFWKVHFGGTPNFSPNYIVPNKFSIIHSLSNDNSFSVLPEFLCRGQKDIHIIKSQKAVTNPLFFCNRKRMSHHKEVDAIIALLKEKTSQF